LRKAVQEADVIRSAVLLAETVIEEQQSRIKEQERAEESVLGMFLFSAMCRILIQY